MIFRGLWFDRNLGNLLKVNQFGKILQCFHGYKQLNPTEIEQLYPGSVQKKDNKRIFIMNTLFNLAETHLVAALIDYFDNQEHFRQTNDGWVEHEEHSNSENYLTFKQLFQVQLLIIIYTKIKTQQLRIHQGRVKKKKKK